MDRMDRLEGKVAIVTGGGGGIGGATARALAREGAAVLVVDINEAAAEAVAAGIRETPDGPRRRSGPISPTRIRSSRPSGGHVRTFGRLDVLHNNAALTDSDFLSADTAVTELSVEVWERTMAVNLRSQMLMCKHAVPDHGRTAAVAPSSTCPPARRSRATAPGPPTACRRRVSTP